eukprot:6478078-Amphidinium_carterae.3
MDDEVSYDLFFLCPHKVLRLRLTLWSSPGGRQARTLHETPLLMVGGDYPSHSSEWHPVIGYSYCRPCKAQKNWSIGKETKLLGTDRLVSGTMLAELHIDSEVAVAVAHIYSSSLLRRSCV